MVSIVVLSILNITTATTTSVSGLIFVKAATFSENISGPYLKNTLRSKIAEQFQMRRDDKRTNPQFLAKFAST